MAHLPPNFENKEDLLFTLAERKIGEDLATLDEMFHVTDPYRKLRRFLRYHCRLCLTDPGYLYVFLSLIQINRKFYQLPAYNPLKQYGEFLINIIKEGQREGVFMPEINPKIFRNMFFRGLIVGKIYDTDKMSEIEEVTDLLTASVSK